MARKRDDLMLALGRRVQRAFGIRLKQCRNSKTAKQSALAAALRVSRTTISNIENGKHRPFLDQAYLAARALGVDISEVLPAMGDVFSAQVVATAADDPLSPEGALAVAALATSVRESARAPTRKRRR